MSSKLVKLFGLIFHEILKLKYDFKFTIAEMKKKQFVIFIHLDVIFEAAIVQGDSDLLSE